MICFVREAQKAKEQKTNQKATRESKPEARKAAKKIEPEAKTCKSKFSIGRMKIASKNRSREYKCTIGTKCSPKGFPKRKSERLLSVSPKANSIRQA